MSIYEILGWIGFGCALLMFMPQVIKVSLTKNVSSLSASSFLINFFGASMYVLYGTAIQPKSYQAFTCNAIIMAFMLVIIFYLFKQKGRLFIVALTYEILVLVIALIFIFLLKDDLPISVKYIFVILGGGAIGGAFVPQLKKMIIERNFKSYSLIMALLIMLNTIPWIVYWIGTIGNMTELELPTGIIALVWTILQGLIQTIIIIIYLTNKKRTK